MYRAFATIAALLCLAEQVFAAEPAAIDELLRQRAESFVGKSFTRWVAIGIVAGDAEHKHCFGTPTPSGAIPDENTIFEIGSITKTFTGLLLADAVVRGEASLDRPVAEMLSNVESAPQFEGRGIRLVDLATHTSGLPRMPTNMGPLVNPLNPYGRYQAEDLRAFLAECKLRQAPGSKYEYSNVGMGLLGHALAHSSDRTYEEFIEQRICRPLGMHDTGIALSDDQKSRLATGFTGLGLPMMNWDFPGIPGCGAIRSSLHDMLIYVRANLTPDATPLAKAIPFSHEPRFTIREPTADAPVKLEIGLGWHITTEGDTRIVWHNGMTGGYASFLALVPAKRWGVVVLGNQATAEIDQLGNGLLVEFLQSKLPKE